MRGVLNRVVGDLVTRYEYRVAQFRDWRGYSRGVEKGVVIVPLVFVLAALGALSAVLLTRPSNGTAYFTLSNEAVPSSTDATTAPADVVTRTVKAKQAAVRVVRRPATGGKAVVRTVSGRETSGQTIREVQTLTTQELATVTDLQQVTVTTPPVTVTAPPVTVTAPPITVTETVKCKPKDC